MRRLTPQGAFTATGTITENPALSRIGNGEFWSHAQYPASPHGSDGQDSTFSLRDVHAIKGTE